MKFGILVYFYLYFTILRVPEKSDETGPLILSPKGPQGLQKQPQGLKSTFLGSPLDPLGLQIKGPVSF